MPSRGILGACVLVAACGTLPVAAQAAGFYMDAAMARSSVSGTSQAGLDAAMIETGEAAFDSFVLNDSSLDTGDTGFSVAVGYQFTPYVAAEAAFIQLGTLGYAADVTVDDGGGPVDLTTGFSFKTGGPALAVIGSWPIGSSLALDARIGAYFAKTQVSVFASDGEASERESLGSEEETGLLLGVGATWQFAANLGLRLGYTRLDQAVAGAQAGDADQLSLGLRVRF